IVEKGGEIVITTSDKDGEVQVAISDTGPGIEAGTINKIFDPFYTTKESGTGLGLAIAKKIIDEHKGSILVASQPGDGTTFTICLPAAN
ncbi:MAG: ATP-binding protein, partial [Candidatus Margulisbacteria bacterium]|nr:ATP-binding protein [Candidatus Margulisiibacteriota bacterium]